MDKHKRTNFRAGRCSCRGVHLRLAGIPLQPKKQNQSAEGKRAVDEQDRHQRLQEVELHATKATEPAHGEFQKAVKEPNPGTRSSGSRGRTKEAAQETI